MPGRVEPSQEELERRRIVGITSETVTNTTSTNFPGNYPGEDHTWNIDKFRDAFTVTFHQNDPLQSTFSLTRLDAPLANAFRRLLIAEVPTLSIENVFIKNNTSIIQDEVLAHRLGLIPLRGSKSGLNWLRWFAAPDSDGQNGSVPADYNTIVLHLRVECVWKPEGKDRARRGETDPTLLYDNTNIYAHQITFEPTGQQVQRFSPEEGRIESANPDILIAKLRPGQKIDLTMHCIKGVGAEHAKFSPVATASYRLLPHIDILKPILGPEARKFARCFPKGVIGLEPVTARESQQADTALSGHEGEMKAVVRDPMRDTVTRECLRHEEFKNKVKLGRVRDHFIFSVESTGQWDSDELFLESVRLLKAKCAKVKRSLDQLMR